MQRFSATPCSTAHRRRAADRSAAHTVAPSSRSTRRCFSPQRPRPTSRTFTSRLLADQLAAQVLGHLVAQETVLHPAHHEEIDEGHEHPVQHAVLRLSETTWPVPHRHLHHPIAAHAKQRGNEPVESSKENE